MTTPSQRADAPQHQDWETPADLLLELRGEFPLILDVCATDANHKCPYWITPETDSLKQDWKAELERAAADMGCVYPEGAAQDFACFMNPPHGRSEHGAAPWVAKAAAERRMGVTTVCVLPVKAGTSWWHEHIYDVLSHHWRTGVEVRFTRGRLHYRRWDEKLGRINEGPATFDSAIVIFRGEPAPKNGRLAGATAPQPVREV